MKTFTRAVRDNGLDYGRAWYALQQGWIGPYVKFGVCWVLTPEQEVELVRHFRDVKKHTHCDKVRLKQLLQERGQSNNEMV